VPLFSPFKRAFIKPHLRLIKLVGVIVPRRLRAGWRQEWEAELRCREALLAEWDRLGCRNKLDLLWRSSSAFWDALWLQPKRLEDEMFQDLRFGLRMLVKHPGFTSVVVLTLALGIGANTAIFGVVNALILRPLPYPDPERLVWVEEVSRTNAISEPDGKHFADWQQQSRTLESIAQIDNDAWTLAGAGEPERVQVGLVSASFFPLLGLQPLPGGRNFTADEDKPGGERVVIINYDLWQRRYSSDQQITGKTITLNDASYTVIGVLPANLRIFYPYDVWVPQALDLQKERASGSTSYNATVARLKPGVTREQARAELDTLLQRYRTSRPEENQRLADSRTRLTPLQEYLLGDTRNGVLRRALLVLLGAVGLILLIACSNVANLLLARAATRQKELAVRAALGASRFRLARQMLTECLLLAITGGAAGLVLAYWLTSFLSSLNTTDTIGDMARISSISIDWRVLGFAMLLSLLTGLLFGLLPALRLARPDLNYSLKEGGRGSGSQGKSLRSALMVSEVALAIVLLAGAGLLIRSFVNLLGVDPGYRAENLLTARIQLPPRYSERSRRVRFYEQTLERLAALPGVVSVGATSHLPLLRYNLGSTVRVRGRLVQEGDNPVSAPIAAVNPDYFRTMSIGLRAGRLLNDADDQDAPSVVLLSETLARRLFPNEDPLGQQIGLGGVDSAIVVGVVGDIRHHGLDREIEGAAYFSYRQLSRGLVLVLRSAVDPHRLAPAVRNAMHEIDPSLAVYGVMTMNERLSDSVAARRFNLLLLGGFAALALLLAGIGVYGVISYVATQRTHEIGIRMALGASSADVSRLFVRQGMALVLLGVGLGLLSAFALTRLMSSLLFGVDANDPLTYAAVAVLLSAIALMACSLPARRAARVDPLVALRHE
jgi:putative ABC transport system permease protein